MGKTIDFRRWASGRPRVHLTTPIGNTLDLFPTAAVPNRAPCYFGPAPAFMVSFASAASYKRVLGTLALMPIVVKLAWSDTLCTECASSTAACFPRIRNGEERIRKEVRR